MDDEQRGEIAGEGDGRGGRSLGERTGTSDGGAGGLLKKEAPCRGALGKISQLTMRGKGKDLFMPTSCSPERTTKTKPSN